MFNLQKTGLVPSKILLKVMTQDQQSLIFNANCTVNCIFKEEDSRKCLSTFLERSMPRLIKAFASVFVRLRDVRSGAKPENMRLEVASLYLEEPFNAINSGFYHPD